MTLEFIDDGPKAADAIAELAREPSLALDLEAAGFHRYSDRLCLIQISTPGGRDVILDPLALELADSLRPLLENPEQTLFMHGGDYDFRLLDRDLDIHPQGVFDTQIAAALLGVEGIGLAALVAVISVENSARVLIGLALAPIVLGCAMLETQKRLVFPKAFLFLGAASYSIYLVHNPIQSIVSRALQGSEN